MRTCKTRLNRFVLAAVLLLLGICLALPITAYAAKGKAKYKFLNVKLENVEQQETEWLFRCTMSWNAVKGCSYYEV